MHDNLGAFGEEPAWTSGDSSACPTPHAVAVFCRYALAEFVRGEGAGLNRDEAEQISKHMRECARCVARFSAIVEEPGVGALARTRPGPGVAVAGLVTAILALMFMAFAQPSTQPGVHTSAEKFDSAEVFNIQRPAQLRSMPTTPQQVNLPPAKPASSAQPSPRGHRGPIFRPGSSRLRAG